MKGTISTDLGKAEFKIEGTWTSDTYYDGQKYVKANCAPGKFFITKAVPPPPPTPVVAIPQAPLAAPISAGNPLGKNFNVVRAYKRPVPLYLRKEKIDRPLDGYYLQHHVDSAKVTPYAPLREADVIFQKRIWLEIDLREKFNNYMAAPKSRLIDALMEGVMQGRLIAYDPTPTPDDPGGDAFYKPLKPEQAMVRLSDSALVTKRDAENNIIDSKLQANPFDPDSIVRFRIKEDWMFDKQRSVFEPRIIGIAPLIKPKGNAPGMDYTPAFWIYFPEARKVLANKPIANASNDATGLSYDDAFIKRLFAGYIIKQTNAADERIKDYTLGIDRLYEAQRIKKQLMDWELDLWQY
ncbi:gliding motility protein GldN [Mucilaginibacter myungsuensis]|uniref:Gliding motility protein GldN n=2 Tax=Mucilaginibacter myungsuensis TaxID=649104 RepID=A0A929PVS6_9SPHI|nr:gliding motility protein GldN [Mucilaginibacter myungsuensis]